MGFTRCPCCALSPLPPLSTVDADLVSAGLLLVDTHNHLHQSAGGAVRRCDSYESLRDARAALRLRGDVAHRPHLRPKMLGL